MEIATSREQDQAQPHPRASRYQRPAHPPHMQLTARDKLVVKAVNDCRVIRQDQLQRLLFPSRNTAQVRLQLLWQHGYLRREFLPVLGGIQTSPIVYLVDRLGVELLRHAFGYDEPQLRYSRQPNLDPRFLQHTLGLSELRVAVEIACRHHSYRLRKWWDEKVMKADYDRVQLNNGLAPILPDAYFVVGLPSGVEHHFFVEYDSGTEGLKFIKRKMTAYLAYYLSGRCKARYGTDRIRVLMVVEGSSQTAGRLASIRHVVALLSEQRWFWFANLAQVSQSDFLADRFWLPAQGEDARALIS